MRGKVNHFNRGEVDKEVLARDDVKRIDSSASYMNNFVPMRLGPMKYRPPLQYIYQLSGTDHYLVPFVSSIDSTAILVFKDNTLSFLVNDVPASSTAVTSTLIANFIISLAGWTDASTGSATTEHYQGQQLGLTGDGNNKAISYQTVTDTEIGAEHTLKILINQAPVTLKIGTNGVSSVDIFSDTLKPGTHFITFTPDANFTVTFENDQDIISLIGYIKLQPTQEIGFQTNIDRTDLNSINYRQSADVVYIASANANIFLVEHRGDKSWSIVDYRNEDGPFKLINNSSVSLKVSNLNGDTDLTSDEDYFTTDSIGKLYKLGSNVQNVQSDLAGAAQSTNSIRVNASNKSLRDFEVNISGTFVGTVTLEQSIDDLTWVTYDTYTSPKVETRNDGIANATLYYRLTIKAGEYTSGTADARLFFDGGSIEGICRVTEYTSSTTVKAQILDDFGSLDYTKDWYEGEWSNNNYPTTVDIFEGRLFLTKGIQYWGSVSDNYYSHELGEGNSFAISKTIGFGTLDSVKWIKANTKLVLGSDTNELTVRSSRYGDILTQSTSSARSGSNQGSAVVDPIVIDDLIYFVQRSKGKIYELNAYQDQDKIENIDINLLNKRITEVGIKRIVFTRQPETRIYAVLDDGTVAIYTTDKAEDVSAWSRMDTPNGLIVDAVVLPEVKEDRVYFVVSRNGVHYLEKLGFYSENLELDFYDKQTNTTQVITGLARFEGNEVYVNGDGLLYGPYTVSSGEITLIEDDTSYDVAYIGYQYTASYISNKLSGFQKETVLTERKRVYDTGLVLTDYYQDAINIGPTSAELSPLPSMEYGVVANDTGLIEEYNELHFPFDGRTISDPRIHIQATRPCTILALTYEIENINSQASDKG